MDQYQQQYEQQQTVPLYVKKDETGVLAIERCAYLKFRGKPPVIENIFPWTPALAQRYNEFEPLKGPPPKVELRNRRTDEDLAASGPRMALLLEAIEMLDPKKDYGEQGKPKIEALRKLVDDNVTLGERDSAFTLFLSRKNR